MSLILLDFGWKASDVSGMRDDVDYLHSSLREKLLEHVFVADLLRYLWQQGRRDMEVLRGEVDYGGHDLVLECNGAIRHVQLKSTRSFKKRRTVTLHTSLLAKPAGCAILIVFDPGTMQLGPFYWFGDAPGSALPALGDRVGRHTRGDKKERPAIRVVNTSSFEKLATMAELARALFGDL